MEDWDEWGRHVLAELKRLSDDVEHIEQSNQLVLVEVAKLKEQGKKDARISGAKSGAAVGAVPAVITALISYFSK
jgi:hypothetical protein